MRGISNMGIAGISLRSAVFATALLCVSVNPSGAVTVPLTLNGTSPGSLVTDHATFDHPDLPVGVFTDVFYFNVAGPTTFNAQASLNSSEGGINPFTLEVWKDG